MAAFTLISGVALTAISGSAQTTAAAGSTSDKPEDKVLKLEKFEVTGSYIPQADASTTVPVTTIDSKTIDNAAINTNVLDLLRKTMPQFSGNGNIGDTNANISANSTGGGAQLAFRNTQTLVLLNGRRVAYAPILAAGGAQFVDVNMFPLSAIDRIEVLQDGASAIYGTDAVAGVVNIILKSNFKGFEVGARYGYTDNKGHMEERKFWLTGGAGNDNTSITVSAEWTDTDPLFQKDRNFSNPIYGTATYAGVVNDAATGQFYVLKPGLNAPTGPARSIASYVADGTYIPVNSSNLTSGFGSEQQYSFNLAQYVTLLQGVEKKIATVNLDHKFMDNLTLFGTLMYTATNTYSQLNAQPFSATIAIGDARNPFSDMRVTARNRLVTRPRQYFYNTNGILGVIGLKGDIGSDWHYEVAANKSSIDQTFINRNLVATAQRVTAVANGTINLFAREQNPGAVETANMLGVANGIAKTTLTSYDARVTGKIADLPGGELGTALLIDYHTEQLSQDADRLSQNATFGWDSATTFNPFLKSRNVWAYMAELNVPIFGPSQKIEGFHSLSIDGAVRHETYNDVKKKPTVPKVTLRWMPFNDEFLVRGTWGKSFIAPALPNLWGPGGVGFTASLNLQRFGGGANIVGQANSRSGSNPNLLPSNSKNYTVGVVWSPKKVGSLNTKGFSIAVDYFNVSQTDLVSTVGNANILQSVELLGTASPYAGQVKFGNPGDTSQFTAGSPVTATGQIGSHAIDQVYVTNTLVNIAGQKLSGVDINAKYTLPTDNWGSFDIGATAGWWKSYTVQTLPDVAPFETVGLASNTNGTIPRWETYTAIDWTRGKWGASLGWQYISSVTDVNAFSTTDSTADAFVEAYNAFDAAVSYSFGSEFKWLKGLKLRVGANNVLNEKPPMAKGTFTQSNTDIATYGAVGRLIFVEGKYSF
jgi:iron complex outermembrane receptor protein